MLTVQLVAFLATMGMQEKIWEVDEESFVNLASKWTCIYRGFNLKLLCLSCFSRIWLLKAVNLTQWNSSIRVFAFLTPLSILWYYSQTVEERNLQSAFSTLNPNHNRDLLLMFYSFQGDIKRKDCLRTMVAYAYTETWVCIQIVGGILGTQ